MYVGRRLVMRPYSKTRNDESGWDVFGAVMLLTSVFGFMGWLIWPANLRLDGAQQFPPPQIVGMNIPASPPGGPPH
jgi:hypothetical protein